MSSNPLRRLSIRTLLLLVQLAVATVTQMPQAHAQSAPIERPTIYFDLGMVLVDTTNDKGFKFIPFAELYIHTLARRGFTLGLISNVPETWGRTNEEKLITLKGFIAANWRERRPFPWELFDRILLSPTEKLRKPHPYLFKLALSYGDRCRPFYFSEDHDEVIAAQKLGLFGYIVGIPGRPFFLAPDRLGCRKTR